MIIDEPTPSKPKTKRKPRKKKEELPEDQKLIEDLRFSFYNISDRTKLDRYREFRKVFMETGEGKRVLSEILGMAKLSGRTVAPFPAEVDVERMLIREGARQLAADIIDVITQEPNMDKPTKTQGRLKNARN